MLFAMFPILKKSIVAFALIAVAVSVHAQSVTTAGETASLSLGSFPPFTVACSVTDIEAGWKVLYPDAKQAEVSDGRQNLGYRTVAGSAFTVERQIEETGGTVRITDTFSGEAGSLQLSKTLNVELPGSELADAKVEFVDGNKPDLNGQTLEKVAEAIGRESVTASGFSLDSSSGGKLAVKFDEPRSMRVGRVEQANRNIFVFRIGYPEAPSKSTFEFSSGSK